MSRQCFVIMPFSSTASCTQEEWTSIFETVFKPAIEGVGLDYECRRSEATRGNIVAAIIRDLNDAHVVLADLTDRNANVFYELGVRHSLKNRSIIVAQRREDLPFDLEAYATHIYDWRTDDGKAMVAETMQRLLHEIDRNPERPDNPVSDFLEVSWRPVAAEANARPISPSETSSAQPLVGPGSKGLDVAGIVRRRDRSASDRDARAIYRVTKRPLREQFESLVEELNHQDANGQIQTDQIPLRAIKFISSGEPHITGIEEFGLASVEGGWQDAVAECLRFAGDLITLSERPRPGRYIRFATGLPAFLAWRLLILMGARALAEEHFDLLTIIVKHPIEVEDIEARFSHRSFVDRRNLFYPEGFLGYADLPIPYLRDLWARQLHLHPFFATAEDYHFQVAQFLMIVALVDAANSVQDRPLYPGYRLLPEVRRAMSALCSRIANVSAYRDGIARLVLNDGGDVLLQRWPALTARANSIQLGSSYSPGGVTFPNPPGGPINEW